MMDVLKATNITFLCQSKNYVAVIERINGSVQGFEPEIALDTLNAYFIASSLKGML